MFVKIYVNILLVIAVVELEILKYIRNVKIHLVIDVEYVKIFLVINFIEEGCEDIYRYICC